MQFLKSNLYISVFLVVFFVFLQLTAGFCHDSMVDEGYPFKVTFASKVSRAYRRQPEIVRAARLFQTHKWISARQIIQDIKNEDMTVLFMKYVMARSFGLDSEVRRIQDILARTAASRLVTFKKLIDSRETRAIIAHYHRDHLKVNIGSLRAQAALTRKIADQAIASAAPMGSNSFEDRASVQQKSADASDVVPVQEMDTSESRPQGPQEDGAE
ncbi:MAG: hypothetical protein CVV64_07140 [Candidatus Wallbacteria bacterium HGW-Wallbacteria-1]|jgi:hypothetical protein|uniref:Uncharacterized protein n=1 Tax=Candidatus Wallbacteria bacterium HGW-Wallbacteria-1 TaxID=2013854 RepID=A0A2N1PTC0_9BACT|nr:MAG: hypothetical protein CVV64_07140 [Candidatus Wallbacteria bacterium HGW-Wallbacteria-1]